MKKLNFCFATIGALVVIITMMISVAPINAQLAGANLSGVVSDESGAPIVGAKVAIKNLATGDVRNSNTPSQF